MKEILSVVQIVISLLLIVLILVQARGTGFGRSSGMGGGASFTRRGLENLIFKSTFVLVALFLAVSILQLLV
jgi:preprotein translocase subunit SecG